MRVLQVVETTGPGGAETVFLDLLEGLPRYDIQPLAVLAGPGWVHEQSMKRGISSVILPSNGSVDGRYLAALRRQSIAFGAQLLHAHMLGSATYATLAGLSLGLPVVATLHGLPDLGRPGLKRQVKALVLRNGASRVVSVSHQLQVAVAETLHLPSAVCDTIYNGIDSRRFVPGVEPELRAALGVAESEVLALAVGNFRPSKGYPILLEAMARVRQQGVPIRLAIVGDDSNALAAEFRARRSALGLEREVATLGFRSDVDALCRAADIYVLSSLDEGFSLTTAQAMATGLAVVATRCGGPEELVRSGVDGMLVEANNPDALAAALISLSRDPHRRAQLGQAARKAVEDRFSTERMLEDYVRLYHTLVYERA